MKSSKRLLAGAATLAMAMSGLLCSPAAQAAGQTPAQPTARKTVYVYATDVHLRAAPNTSAAILATVSHIYLYDYCQTDKNTTAVPDPNGGTNSWWSEVTLTTGSDFAWVSNVYLQGGRKISGVPDC
ncbi:peptidase M23 [Streptomyces sp. NPDC127079]|uniref:peptidase M23 n=1 Tax=Streptomyces sp. NPDC127079 TaxID=3347132 RepID=UPI003669B7BC